MAYRGYRPTWTAWLGVEDFGIWGFGVQVLVSQLETGKWK